MPRRFAVSLSVFLLALAAISPSPLRALPPQRILQVFAGFNQPNDEGMPCAGPCLGLPSGMIAVQPNSFVSPGGAGLYYAVFQTFDWTGTLSVTFALKEGGSVVQTATVEGTVDQTPDQARSALVLSAAATIPDTPFVGPGTITATTVATPTQGESAVLTSYATLEFGTSGERRLVQVFAGMSSSNGGNEYPCAYPECQIANFPGTVVVQPEQFQFGDFSAYYAVFQADDWQGSVKGTCDVIEEGKTVYSIGVDGVIAGQGGSPVELFASSGSPIPGDYVGPATLWTATTATQRGGNQFTLTTYTPVEIQ